MDESVDYTNVNSLVLILYFSVQDVNSGGPGKAFDLPICFSATYCESVITSNLKV